MNKLEKTFRPGDLILASDMQAISDAVDELIDSPAAGLTSITYAELAILKAQSKLTPGNQYRITDFVTTTSQADTRSAGHAFDVIVTADSESTLNETARAIQHEGDTYFADSNLAAWEIKYCFDNDTSRFAWASSSGKGVIYYMKDEFQNETFYDFKNILFYYASIPQGNQEYAIEDNDKYYYTFTLLKLSGSIYNSTDSSLQGDVNYIKNNVIKLNNITFSESGNNSGYSSINSQETIYTFETNLYVLSFNVFLNLKNNNNFIGLSSHHNIFAGYCNNNVLGKACYYNIFNGYSNSNLMKDGCIYNNIDQGCTDNYFGNSCATITLDDNCSYNHFEDGCGFLISGSAGSNTRKIYLYSSACHNYLGSHCAMIEISGKRNTIKQMCAGIKINGNDNYIGSYSLYLYLSGSNNFIEESYNNGPKYYSDYDGSFGGFSSFPSNPLYLANSTIGQSCSNITTSYSNNYNIHIKNNCYDITFSKNYNNNIVIEPGCHYLTITSPDSTASNNLIQNIHIHEGISSKSISVGAGLNYQTDVYSTNHQTLTV